MLGTVVILYVDSNIMYEAAEAYLSSERGIFWRSIAFRSDHSHPVRKNRLLHLEIRVLH